MLKKTVFPIPEQFERVFGDIKPAAFSAIDTITMVSGCVEISTLSTTSEYLKKYLRAP